jgi:hypothetical protein
LLAVFYTFQDGVAMKLQDESIDITTTKYSMAGFKKKKKNCLEYGTFLKVNQNH